MHPRLQHRSGVGREFAVGSEFGTASNPRLDHEEAGVQLRPPNENRVGCGTPIGVVRETRKGKDGPPALLLSIYTSKIVSGLGRHSKNERHMNTRKIALLIFLGLVFVGCNRQTRPPANVAEVGTRMTALMKQYRFDEAAQLGIDASARKPADAMTHYWVALAYAEKAHYEPNTKDASLKLVSEYARKSVALDPNDRVIGFNVAWVLEYAGDVDSSSRCKYYADSQQLLNQMSSKVSGDAVLTNQVAASTSRISEKVKAAHCG